MSIATDTAEIVALRAQIRRLESELGHRADYSRKLTEAFAKTSHAGLEAIANLDWLDALRHGCSEALWLVEKLLRCVDESEVAEVFAAWNEAPVNEEDTWVLDERA